MLFLSLLHYKFMILNADELSTVYAGKNSDHQITTVKYSPDNKYFACASADYKVHIHENSLETKYKLISIAEKHNGIVTALDFTIDSQFFQSISSNQEIIFCKYNLVARNAGKTHQKPRIPHTLQIISPHFSKSPPRRVLDSRPYLN